MLMIPLPFVIALFAALLLARELTVERHDGRNNWLIAFLCLLIFQEILIGLRFGYGFDDLFLIQPFTASMLPPLAYLSFRRPPSSPALLVHLLPLVGVLLSVTMLFGMLDAVLALSNVFYAIALIRLGLRGGDGIAWVELRRVHTVLQLLWFVVAVLILSGITDAAIVMDHWTTQGSNISKIAGWASAIGIVAVTAGFAFYWFLGKKIQAKTQEDTGENRQVFDRLGSMMATEKLHLDPDINLNRIARRMILPARDVSQAVNTVTGDNVSKYINSLRVEEACRLLEETDMPITQVVFASGFNTKSNFHREFARVKNQSPSDWRGTRGRP